MKRSKTKISPIGTLTVHQIYRVSQEDGTIGDYVAIADIRRISDFRGKPVLLRMYLLADQSANMKSCALAEDTCMLTDPSKDMAYGLLGKEPTHYWPNCEVVAEMTPLAPQLLMFLDAYHSSRWTKYMKLQLPWRRVVASQIELMSIATALKQQ